MGGPAALLLGAGAMKLTRRERELHDSALAMAARHRTTEASLVEVFVNIRGTALFKKLDVNGSFEYATRFLNFSESTAFALKAVSARCLDLPTLRAAIADERLSLAKAKRIVSVLNADNADELIAFAETATYRELERKIASIRPRPAPATRITYVNENTVKLTTCFELEGLVMHERVKALEAQRGNFGDFQKRLYEVYLKHNDPVAKAERARPRGESGGDGGGGGDPGPGHSARAESGRTPLTAAQKHAVFRRDQGRCTHVYPDGTRCNQDRHVEIHHIIPVSEGGTNDPSNLTTLCWFHHDLLHQTAWSLDDEPRPP